MHGGSGSVYIPGTVHIYTLNILSPFSFLQIFKYLLFFKFSGPDNGTRRQVSKSRKHTLRPIHY